jgi:hypothetical protein
VMAYVLTMIVHADILGPVSLADLASFSFLRRWLTFDEMLSRLKRLNGRLL